MQPGEELPLGRSGQGRDHHARSAGQEKPAHFRILRRVARDFPGAGARHGNQGGCHHRCGRKFLLRRRCVRDHRPADPDEDAGAAGLHPDDRRRGEGDARLSAADHRGGGRRMRRRRRNPGDGVRPPLRHAAESRTAFLFARVGLAGCDMGACAILPRIIGQGRAAELLYTGRSMTGEEGERWGFFNALHPPGQVLEAAQAMAASSPGTDLRARHHEDDAASRVEHGYRKRIEAEAQAQALCMATEDFRRAFEAFSTRQRPQFRGD